MSNKGALLYQIHFQAIMILLEADLWVSEFGKNVKAQDLKNN